MQDASTHNNEWKYFVLGGLVSGGLACLYNLVVFKFLGFYPEVLKEFEGRFFDFGNPLLYVFLKDFLVGFVLAYLFRHACMEINKTTWKGIMYFVFYSVFAFTVFGLGDIYLLRRFDGLFLLLTVDGFIETILCTLPIKLFSRDCFD